MTVISLYHKIFFLLNFFVAIVNTASLQADVVFKSLNPTHVAEAVAVQGGLLLGKTEEGNKVWLDKQSVRVAKDGTFIIGFGRDASSAVLLIEQKNGEQQYLQINIQPRKYKIDRIDGLPPAKVNPKGEAVLKRIREESALTRKARGQDDERQDFKPGFIWPAKGRISGVYGSQRILNGEAKWPHYGVDIAAPTGSAVIAPAPGIVTMTHNDMYFSGGTMIIDHGHGLTSTFLHLSKILVKEGTYVKQGDRVAEIGATGRVTGSHLDWRLNWFKVRLDPQPLVEGLPMTSWKSDKEKNDG